MGRYYRTETGRGGKFGFGSQPSNAPENFGLSESQTSIQYYGDEEDFDLEYLIKCIRDQGYKLEEETKQNIRTICIELLDDNGEIFDWNKELAEDLYLGATIYLDILDEGYCNLEADI